MEDKVRRSQSGSIFSSGLQLWERTREFEIVLILICSPALIDVADELQVTANLEHDGELARLYADQGDRDGGNAAGCA